MKSSVFITVGIILIFGTTKGSSKELGDPMKVRVLPRHFFINKKLSPTLILESIIQTLNV